MSLARVELGTLVGPMYCVLGVSIQLLPRHTDWPDGMHSALAMCSAIAKRDCDWSERFE